MKKSKILDISIICNFGSPRFEDNLPLVERVERREILGVGSGMDEHQGEDVEEDEDDCAAKSNPMEDCRVHEPLAKSQADFTFVKSNIRAFIVAIAFLMHFRIQLPML